MRLFFLTTKQKHTHKPHVHPHSAQRWVLHFTSFQHSEIPRRWWRTDIIVSPHAFPLSPSASPFLHRQNKSLSNTELSLSTKQAKPEEIARSRNAPLALLQRKSRQVAPLSACLPLSLLPKNHPGSGHPGAPAEDAAHTSKVSLQTLQRKKS